VKQMRSVQRGPRRRAVAAAIVALAGLSVVAPLAAQESTHSHSRAIDRLVREIGGIQHVASARPAQISNLVRHLMDRGQLFLDLYEYQRLVGRDYAVLRDSIARDGGVSVPSLPYLLGRSYQELGQNDRAAQAYRRVAGASVKPALRTMATEWSASLGRTGSGWRQRVVDWRQGRPGPASACPAVEVAECALFQALTTRDAASILRAQRPLLDQPQPVNTLVVLIRGGSFRIDIHDPLPLYLLAASDFMLASSVLEQGRSVLERANVAVGDEVRGLVLLRSGQLAEAEAVLSRAAASRPGLASVYLAEVQHRRGNRAGADATWARAAAMSPLMELVALESRSAVESDRAAALRAYRAQQRQGLKELKLYSGALLLARVLLRHGLADEALQVLDAARPPSWGSDLNRIKPQVLVLHSRARYLAGRETYGLARGDLANVADVFSAAGPLLDMLQEITAPSNFGEIR
jgi:tetratricopeptide (TPR) repeat protein